MSSTAAPEALSRVWAQPERDYNPLRGYEFQWSNSYALARLAPPEVHPQRST